MKASASRPLAAALVLLACVNRHATAPAARPATANALPRCVLVDSDGGLDDLRAVTALVGGAPSRHLRLAAVVTTSGLASAEGGARAMRELVRRLGVTGVPVIEGAATATRTEHDQNASSRWWRATAESLNGVLAAVPPPPTGTLPPWSEGGAEADATALRRHVREALAGCGDVELAMIGPWTSYALYAPELEGHATHVTAQGCAPDLTLECGRRTFNCRLDCAACQAGVERFEQRIDWVSVPPSDAAWSPTAAWFESLGGGRGATVLREVFLRTPSTWTCSGVAPPCVQASLWDDAVVACILEPSRCAEHAVAGCVHRRPAAATTLQEILRDAIGAVP